MKKLFLFLMLCYSITAFSQRKYIPVKSADEKLNEEYCTGLFNTAYGTYFDLSNDEYANSISSYFNILDWLQGRVAGLQVYALRNDDRIAFIRNRLADIYVDEMRVDPGFLNDLAVTDIAMIKIIKEPFAGNIGNAGGVIAIYTYKGDEDDDE